MKTRTLTRKAVIPIALAIALLAYGYIDAIMHTTFSVPNKARVKGVGVSIWWDYNCTKTVDEIDWGTIEPNETKTTPLFFRSRSNVNVTLWLTTENWVPENATEYMNVSWNYTGDPLEPKTVMAIELYLHVAHNVTGSGIDHFSFDIRIYAEG